MNQVCVIRGESLTGEHSRYACLRCTEHIRRHIREIEGYTHMLATTTMLTPRRGEPGRRSPGFGSVPPLNVNVLDLLDPRTDAEFDEDSRPILWRLDSLCQWVREESDRVYRADLSGMVVYLLGLTEWVAHQPWADDYAGNVAELHSVARAAAGDAPQPPLAPCLKVDCDGPVFWSHGDAAKCRDCGTRYVGLGLVRLRCQGAA